MDVLVRGAAEALLCAYEVAVSIFTQKMAMCLRYVLTDIFRVLLYAPHRFALAMRRAIVPGYQ